MILVIIHISAGHNGVPTECHFIFYYCCLSIPFFPSLRQYLEQSAQLFWLLPGDNVHSYYQTLNSSSLLSRLLPFILSKLFPSS